MADTTAMRTELSLLRLMQLVSPTLPIGAYAYSQGLEAAVERAWVKDEKSLEQWATALLDAGIARVDLPILERLHRAWCAKDADAVRLWSTTLVALRDTAELRQDERDRGQALARLLAGLGCKDAEPWRISADASLPTLFALAAASWHIDEHQAVAGYAWSWLENLVLTGVKLIPLGQLTGQRVLLDLSKRIPDAIARAASLDDDDIGGSLLGVSIASCAHETQYSRLFRS